METLNVSLLEPRLKHPTIFMRFDALSEGDSFLIDNDHDPKPLYYQMVAERGQIFEWEYQEEGPERWKVKITKLKAGTKPVTIGEMVAADFRKAEVFRKFGLDFCCGGKKTLEKACREKGLDVLEVKASLEAAESQPDNSKLDFQSMTLDVLADYVLTTHHTYVTQAIPMLYEFSTKVARVHGDRHPEVVEIARIFDEVASELRSHMHKEEFILFPFIKQLAASKRSGDACAMPPFGTIKNPIAMMESEHVSAGGGMEEIHRLTNNFTPPSDACGSYRVLFAKLDEFEKDLHQHIHLENNILFPKAILLEEELFGN